MIQHFFHPAVLIAYTVVCVTNFMNGFPVTGSIVLVQITILAAIDYAVHCSNHAWRRLPFPEMTLVWILFIAWTLVRGLVSEGWQVALLAAAQAWWDNSQHSVINHRPKGVPETHTDHSVIRTGAILVFVAVVALPRALAISG